MLDPSSICPVLPTLDPSCLLPSWHWRHPVDNFAKPYRRSFIPSRSITHTVKETQSYPQDGMPVSIPQNIHNTQVILASTFPQPAPEKTFSSRHKTRGAKKSFSFPQHQHKCVHPTVLPSRDGQECCFPHWICAVSGAFCYGLMQMRGAGSEWIFGIFCLEAL